LQKGSEKEARWVEQFQKEAAIFFTRDIYFLSVVKNGNGNKETKFGAYLKFCLLAGLKLKD